MGKDTEIFEGARGASCGAEENLEERGGEGVEGEFIHLSVCKNMHGIIPLSYGLLLMTSSIDNILNTLYNDLRSSDV